MPNLYHLSMGYVWPKNPTSTFTGALLTGAVLATNPSTPTVSNFNSLNDDDQIVFYVYDLASSGTTPSLPGTWISITPASANQPDQNLFDQSPSTLNSGSTLPAAATTPFYSVYFQLTVPSFQVVLSSGLNPTVEQNSSTTQSGQFSVIVTISVTDGTNVGTYTSYDPTMIVNPG